MAETQISKGHRKCQASQTEKGKTKKVVEKKDDLSRRGKNIIKTKNDQTYPPDRKIRRGKTPSVKKKKQRAGGKTGRVLRNKKVCPLETWAKPTKKERSGPGMPSLSRKKKEV